MIRIDGAQGEGGGQVLRTSLALSAITGEPLELHRIRAGRRKPGLLRQHLTATLAMAEICGAAVEGAELGAQRLCFTPGPVRAGAYAFAVGTAGSANLVLQTVLPALASAGGDSLVVVQGGTHNSMAPTTDFLAKTFAPALARFGPVLELTHGRFGFYPAGGGELTAEVRPAPWRAAELGPRGAVSATRVISLSSQVPDRVGRNQVGRTGSALGVDRAAWRSQRVQSAGPGNVHMVEVDTELGTMVFTAFGERGKSAEDVSDAVLAEVQPWLETEVFVDEHLADQLLLPMALAGGGSLLTTRPSLHTTTNIAVIEAFLPVRFTVGPAGRAFRVTVAPAGDGR